VSVEIQNPTEFIAQSLDWFSQAALKSMCSSLGIKPAPAQRPAIIGALAGIIGTPAHPQILDVRLSDEMRSLLGTLPVRTTAFPLRHLLSVLKQRGTTGAGANKVVHDILRYGCLMPGAPPVGASKLGINVGEYNFTGMHLEYVLTPGLEEWAERQSEFEVKPLADAPPGEVIGSGLLELQRMLFVLTAEAARQPIRLTNAGTPNRNDLSRLLKSVKLPGVPASGREPPPLLWLALAIGAAAQLFDTSEGDLRPKENLAEFFQRPIEEQLAYLIEGWRLGVFNDFAFVPTLSFGTGRASEPWLHSSMFGYSYGLDLESMANARTLICAMLDESLEAAPDAWYSLDDFATALFQHVPEILFPRVSDHDLYASYYYGYNSRPVYRPQYPGVYRIGVDGKRKQSYPEGDPLYMDTDWPEVEGAFIRQVLGESMRWLGLVEVDRPADGSRSTRFHLTPLGQHFILGQPLPNLDAGGAAVRVIVQPSFEVVVVDAASNWSLLAQFDQFAERRSLDRAATYHLSQAALVQGMDRGWTGQRILETLERANGNPLPQNVRYSLQEWIGRYEALSVREHATVLEADSERQLDQWLDDPNFAPLLGHRLGPTAVLVPKEHVERLLGRPLKRASVRSIDYSVPLEKILALHEPDVIEMPKGQADPYLAFRLGQFSVREEATDEATRYRITAESVAQAAREGLVPSQILEFLAAASPKRVPVDMSTRIRGWGGAVSPVQSEALVAVVLQNDRPDWSDLRRIKAIGRLIRAAPTLKLALVAPDDLEALREELAVRGIEVQAGQIPEDTPDRVALLKRALDAFGSSEEAVKQLEAMGVIKHTPPPISRRYY